MSGHDEQDLPGDEEDSPHPKWCTRFDANNAKKILELIVSHPDSRGDWVIKECADARGGDGTIAEDKDTGEKLEIILGDDLAGNKRYSLCANKNSKESIVFGRAKDIFEKINKGIRISFKPDAGPIALLPLNVSAPSDQGYYEMSVTLQNNALLRTTINAVIDREPTNIITPWIERLPEPFGPDTAQHLR